VRLAAVKSGRVQARSGSGLRQCLAQRLAATYSKMWYNVAIDLCLGKNISAGKPSYRR
jgi:hypothetical protein